jgi:hypothetical protein
MYLMNNKDRIHKYLLTYITLIKRQEGILNLYGLKIKYKKVIV